MPYPLSDRPFLPPIYHPLPPLSQWYHEAELYNGRTAMAAVVGILVTEALGKPDFWTEAQTQQYWLDTPTLALIMVRRSRGGGGARGG